ncbi:MAG: DUF7151 family protein [Thermodesulfobacteriota bacterium]
MDGGGIINIGGTAEITNSIVSGNTAVNSGNNCYNNGTINDNGNNLSNDATCGFSGDNNNSINLGQLADNGGPTLTHALLSGSSAINAGDETVCADPPVNGIDQRNFLRNDGFCDIGAYEAQPTASVTITKQTSPPGRAGFDFTSTGFPDGCDIEDMFTLDDGDALNCIVPAGNYTITETPLPPSENILNIQCSELPFGAATNNATGALTFTVATNGDNVNCRFMNLVPNALFDISDEPAGANCADGGVRIDEGLDTNGNSVLDPGEINDTTFVCNGGDGTDGSNALVNVTPEPAGANCANGGNKIDTGLDTSGDGILDLAEILNTFFVCNGAQGTPGTPGEDGNDGDGSGGNGCGSVVGEVNTASALGNIFVTLIPAIVGFAGLFWRRRD